MFRLSAAHDATARQFYVFISLHLVFTSGNWWSTFEPPVFQWLVEVYKEVVVYLLRMHKVGIPSVEQRIFTCFLHTSLRFLEILHTVRNVGERPWICFPAASCVKFVQRITQHPDRQLLTIILLMLQVNERAGHIIQYDKFYIHELDDLIDIRNDYVTWIQRQMYPPVSLQLHDSLD